jgi:hypothetical protein
MYWNTVVYEYNHRQQQTVQNIHSGKLPMNQSMKGASKENHPVQLTKKIISTSSMSHPHFINNEAVVPMPVNTIISLEFCNQYVQKCVMMVMRPESIHPFLD